MIASIIIPTCNRTKDLKTCLDLLIPQLPSPQCVEVIVTDDGVNAESQLMVQNDFPLVRWTKGPCRGPAANRNHGASLSTATWLIFLDDDCQPTSSYLRAYLDFFSHPDPKHSVVIAVGPTMMIGKPSSLLWEAPHNPCGQHIISSNLCLMKETFNQVGRFDERFPTAAFEDTEFEFRCRYSGLEPRLISAAVVHHALRHRPMARRLAARWEGKVIYAFDHTASSSRILLNLPWHVIRVIQSRFRGCQLSGENLKALKLFIAEWFWVLYLTPRWIKKWKDQPRSKYWTAYVQQHGPEPKCGF